MGQIDLVTAGDITTVRRHRGSGTTPPSTGINPGDTYSHTTSGLLIYSGTAWSAATVSQWPVALVRPTSSQTAQTAWRAVIFGIADVDSHAGWNLTSPTRWTVPTNQGGVYAIEGSVAFSSSAAGQWMLAALAKNGTHLPASWGSGGSRGTTGGGAATTARVITTLAAGDYIELMAYNDGVATVMRYTTADGGVSSLSIERIR